MISSSVGKERMHLLADQIEESSRKYPQPLTFSWRLWHAIAYLIGGTTFLVGSTEYLPSIATDTGYVIGGWLFTIGSAAFVYADASEWWLNNRVGCFMYDHYEEDYEKQVSKTMAPKETLVGRYQRAENGLNFFFSLTGSTIYLIGSIFYIPSTNESLLGTELFIYGSACIFLSQSWKIYRAGFPIQDWPAFGVDLFAGLGGVAYFIGSILFLPTYNTSTYIATVGASIFILGGSFFTISGLFIIYRYFLTAPTFPH